MNAAAALDPQIFKAGLDGGLTADGGAADNRRLLAKLGGQFDAGILQSLAGGDQGKLREAVDVSILAAGKIFQGIVAAHFGAVLKSKGGAVGGLDGANGGAASAERGPVSPYIQAGGGNHPRPVMATRRGAMRQVAGVAESSGGVGGVAAMIFFMPSTISLTVLRERTSSSGMEILKAFSSSKSRVKTSSESIPRSCRLVSSLMVSAGMRFTDASVEITFSATSSAI